MSRAFVFISLVAFFLLSCNDMGNSRLADDFAESKDSIIPPKIFRITKPIVTLLDTCPPPPVVTIPKVANVQSIAIMGQKLPVKMYPLQIKAADFYSPTKNYNIDQGLPTSSVASGFKDKDGNIWFGTYGHGVSRFDGKNFTNYTVANGLVGNTINSILQDDHGDMWFATTAGVSRYNGRYFRNYTTAHGLMHNTVTAVKKDKQGNIWVGTYGGVNRFDGKNSFYSFSENKKLTSPYVLNLLIDKQGTIWMEMIKGVCRFDGKDFDTLTVKDGLLNDKIVCMTEDSKGNIWFGTSNGASCYDGHQFTNYHFSERSEAKLVYCITEDREGTMWFGTQGAGVYCYSNKEFTVDSNQKQTHNLLTPKFANNKDLINVMIQAITEDNDGNLWFGTFGNGIICYNGSGIHRCTNTNDLPSNYVYSFAEDKKGNIWFNNYPNWLICYNGNRNPDNTVTNTAKIKNQYPTDTISTFTTIDLRGFITDIWAVCADQYDHIWMGTSFGVMKFDGKTLSMLSYDHGFPQEINVKSIKEDRSGNLWFCTDEMGVICYNGNKKVHPSRKEKYPNSLQFFNTKNGFIDNRVSICAEAMNGDLWFGTSNGASCYHFNDLEKGQSPYFTHYTVAQGLANNSIRSIMPDKSGNIWFCTADGLSRYDGHSFLNFNMEHGLANENIKGVAIDREGIVWVGTQKGLSRLFFKRKIEGKDPRNTDSLVIKSDTTIYNKVLLSIYTPVFENYNLKNGYPIPDIKEKALFIDSKNVIWAGTGQKPVRFDYHAFHRTEKAPELKLIIHRIKINNEAVSWNTLSNQHSAKDGSGTDSLKEAIEINEEVTVFGHKLSSTQRRIQYEKFHSLQFDSVSPFYYLPQKLELPYRFNNITFEYASILPENANRMSYQYMLDGSDQDWLPVTEQTVASFSNIPEGTYNFKLRVRSNNGPWSEATLYSFRVLPPWYRSLWAYFIYTCLSLSLIWMIVRWRTVRLEHDKLILEGAVKERTTEALTQKEEAERQKRIAEESAKAKENFLSNMSHEIRTPLNAISGYTGLSLEQELPKRVRDHLQIIKLSSDHLKRMVDDILDLSKIESGKFSFNDTDFELEQVIVEVKTMLRLKAQEKGNELKSHISTDIPTFLHGDKNRLVQVLINLLDNAIKFTNQGRIDIHVDLLSIHQENVSIRFRIKDNGVGINAGKLENIFESFTQADNTIARKYGGTGLGLSISKRIIELQGGEIFVESKENKGTLFTFHIVYKYGNKPLHQEEYSGLPSHSFTTSFRILAAEDDSLNRDLLGQFLNKWNLDYDFTESGPKLLELLRKNTYDLVLLDIHMPGMNGFEVVNTIRTSFASPLNTIPIIALTADVLPSTRQKILQTGMNDYVYKPIDAHILFDKIDQYLLLNKELPAQQANSFKWSKDTRHFKPDYLLQNYGDNKNYLLKFLQKTKDKFAEYILALERAHQQNDKVKILHFSHRLVGVARILGIDSIPAHLTVIDQQVKDHGSLETLKDYLLHIQQDAHIANCEINEFIEAFS